MTHKTTLFMLPFAGGTMYSYRAFQAFLSPDVLIKPLEFPGRGHRRKEPALASSTELAHDIFCQVQYQAKGPFSLYGHSLGAMIGFLVCRKLKHAGLADPVHLFVSGSSAPSLKTQKSNRHTLDQKAFFTLIKQIGGTPDGVLKDHDLMCYLEPMLRADIKAFDTYVYSSDEPINAPISVFEGSEDPATSPLSCELWANETFCKTDIYTFPGNHFFIFDHVKALCRIINQKLDRLTNASMHLAG